LYDFCLNLRLGVV